MELCFTTLRWTENLKWALAQVTKVSGGLRFNVLIREDVHVCWYSFYRPRKDGKLSELLAGKKITQIFNPRPGRGSNRGPQDWEAEILPLRQA